MCCPRQVIRGTVLFTLVVAVQASWGASSVEDVVRRVADRLESSQLRDGPVAGSWPSEEAYAGPATAGMVCAYKWLDEIRYDSCAWRGGYYIIESTDLQGNVLGDEAYAFLQLSDVYTPEPPPDCPGMHNFPNIWHDALIEFYMGMRNPEYEGSTAKYLRYFDEGEPSTVVFYLAHHVVASYSVDDIEKTVWLDGLIRHLARVDNESDFPVMALGAATWALAEIGGLDPNTLVSPEGSGLWAGVTLADLPSLLLSHVVPEDAPYAGSLYCCFDHGPGELGGPEAGYTEDAVFGLIGLVGAASRSDPGPARDDMDQAIAAVHEAIVRGVGEEGQVYEHLSRQGNSHHAYAGEVLQALWSVKQYNDKKLAAEPEQE